MRGHFVQTRMANGLTAERAQEAVRILNGPPAPNDLLAAPLAGEDQYHLARERADWSRGERGRRPQSASTTRRAAASARGQGSGYQVPVRAQSRYDAAYMSPPSHSRGREVPYASTRPLAVQRYGAGSSSRLSRSYDDSYLAASATPMPARGSHSRFAASSSYGYR